MASTITVAPAAEPALNVLGDTYERIAAGDPVLLAQLWGGDDEAHRRVARLLRVARPERLRAIAHHLTEVAAACPEVQPGLRAAFTRLDPVFAHRFFRIVSRRARVSPQAQAVH